MIQVTRHSAGIKRQDLRAESWSMPFKKIPPKIVVDGYHVNLLVLNVRVHCGRHDPDIPGSL
jgi:hypothetical protein